MPKILSLDPGKQNFAFALAEDGKIKFHGMLHHCVKDLHNLSPELMELKFEIMDLLKKCDLNPKTDFLIAERFMARRGGGRGCVGEYINIQLGAIASWIVPIELRLTEASTWKNATKRKYGTNDTLEVIKKLGMVQKVVVHEADAIMIGIWAYEKALNKKA